MGIGAGMGLLSGAFGSKKPQMTTTSIDPESQNYLRNQRGFAQLMAGRQMPGLDPNVMAAIQMMQQYGDAGKLGLSAVTGDQGAAGKFMNPYFEAMNPMFDRMRAENLNAVNQQATRPGGGAFAGNNRVGLAQGNAFRNVDESQSQFNYSGFQDAMSRAMQLASGMPAVSDWMKNTGFDLTNRQRNWDVGSMGLMNAGFGQPFSQTTTVPNDRGNIFQQMLGGAMAGASFGGGK
jgi:hypothetical protein